MGGTDNRQPAGLPAGNKPEKKRKEVIKMNGLSAHDNSQLASAILTARADASMEYPEISDAMDRPDIRQYIVDYIVTIHETDRNAPEPTAEDIRAIVLDVIDARDESTDATIEALGVYGQALTRQRSKLQIEHGISPWGRGRLIEHATTLWELIDAGMGAMTLEDAVRKLDTLTLEDD